MPRECVADLAPGLPVIVGTRDKQRRLVERSQEQVGERAHRLALDEACLHRGFERAAHETEAVLEVDLPPPLPPQH